MRRICLVTGSRAEYGHLRCLARAIADDAGLTLQWVVAGAHLAERFGLTCREIEADGFRIDERVAAVPADDSPGATAHAMGDTVTGVASALGRLRPDVLVILGDRHEMLAAAAAALVLGIPVAHVHGGEITEGAFDDAIRHAITKLAHVHFVAAEPYRRRVIQMGEDPARVFAVGAPGLDNVANLERPTLAELEGAVGAALGAGFFLVTYHPVTLDKGEAAAPVRAMLAALDDFPERGVLVTGVNADPGHAAIAAALEAYAAANRGRVVLRASLGETLYLGAMSHAAAVVGNSSSGIIEAPAMGVPSVNVGDRQKGRLRALSVIDCGDTREAIAAAIARALDPAFSARLAGQAAPYGRGGASRRIKDILKDLDLDGITRKRFHDLGARDKACHVA